MQLTAAGTGMAAGGTLRVQGPRRAFTFEPGAAPLHVERSFEWIGILSRQYTPEGLALFELADSAPAGTIPQVPVSAL